MAMSLQCVFVSVIGVRIRVYVVYWGHVREGNTGGLQTTKRVSGFFFAELMRVLLRLWKKGFFSFCFVYRPWGCDDKKLIEQGTQEEKLPSIVRLENLY